MLTQQTLKEYFYYNPATGIFTCIKKEGTKLQVGKIMGSINKAYNRGYVRIGLHGKIYLAHKLAWLYMYNEWPEEIDHINHIREDNRIDNLRLASHTENMKNTKKSKNNSSGITGVTWDKQTSTWRAEIGVRGKGIKLGRFTTLEQATLVRKQAEIDYGFHPNHGN